MGSDGKSSLSVMLKSSTWANWDSHSYTISIQVVGKIKRSKVGKIGRSLTLALPRSLHSGPPWPPAAPLGLAVGYRLARRPLRRGHPSPPCEPFFLGPKVKGLQCKVLATRNPRLPPQPPGTPSNRRADRQSLSLLSHPPPRRTRFDPRGASTHALSLTGALL